MRVKIYKFDEIENIKEFSNQKISLFYSVLVYFLILILILFFIWSFFGKIDLRIKATGVIETEDNDSIIVNIVTGKVKNNNLKQGKKVNKGDLLYEIENENLIFEKSILEKEIKEKENLYNAMNGKSYEMDLLVLNYISKKNIHLSSIKSLNIEIFEQEKLKNINFEILKVGGLSKFEYEKSLNQLNILKEKREQKEMEYNLNINNEKINLETQIRENKVKISSIENNLKNSKVAAPISGYIEIIRNINNGDILSSDVNIAKIVPEKDNYKINIYVGENDIAKIKKGNIINYHLNYPDEKKNIILKGNIILISKDTIIRENGEKYYLIIGNINSENIKKLNLKKGMSLESNIIYSQKSILNYLLEILDFKIKSL